MEFTQFANANIPVAIKGSHRKSISIQHKVLKQLYVDDVLLKTIGT